MRYMHMSYKCIMFSLYYYYYVYYMMYSYNANQYICTAIVLHIYYVDSLCLDHHMILACQA